MMKRKVNLWKRGDELLVMAPMDDVTDVAFRQVFAQYGTRKMHADTLLHSFARFFPANKNFISFTEFVSSDGLALADDKSKLLKKLEFKKNEHPIVAQIFGSNIVRLKEAARLVESLGFDGVDINMGCPDRSVEKTGSGAALIKNPERALEIVSTLKESVTIPVSVKTRLGYSKIDFKWIETILSSKPDALTVHLRTRAEMSKVDAHWETVPEIIEIKDKVSKNTALIANGDIKSLAEAKEKLKSLALDGVMIGRGLFGNPLFFTGESPGPKLKIKLLIEHLKLFEKHLLGVKSYSVMKKHFKAYISSFSGAHELRANLMETNTCSEAVSVLKNALRKF